MTTVRQMFALQELDIILDRVQDDENKTQNELNNGDGIGDLESALQRDSELLQESELQQRATKLEAETQKERSETLNSQLYGGEITNPRDLESLEHEHSNVLKLIEQHEAALDNIADKVAVAQFKKSELEDKLDEARAAWQIRQTELQDSLKELVKEREEIELQRSKLTEVLDPVSLQQYELLRKSKGGLAVA
ncbi:MAG: hypothetical protein VYA78_00250, partial [Chloroflexota bacterium]|nr:hypothetical protein [Chloroflexota bacterium]